MATRREKLANVLKQASDLNETVEDLYDRITTFHNQGKSGIESFLDETLAAYDDAEGGSADTSVLSQVKAQLYAAIATLDSV
jgi:hypothetical protein